jgi:hypothetical protein
MDGESVAHLLGREHRRTAARCGEHLPRLPSRREPAPGPGPWRAPLGEADARPRGAAVRQAPTRRNAPGGVHHVHRTLRAALNEAVRRSHRARNPVLVAKAPKLDEDEVEPYDVPEIQRLLKAAKRRNGARWALALALGLRQGEDVALEKGTLCIRRSRLRPRYSHGCGGTCGTTPGRCAQRQAARPAERGQIQGWPPRNRLAAPARRPAPYAPGRAATRTGGGPPTLA